MRVEFLPIFFVLLVGIAYAQGIESFSYYNQYRIESSVNLVDYQVKIILNTTALIAQGKMRNDCGDLRVYDANLNELPYWIDRCNHNNTTLWTKLSIPQGTSYIFVVYGNQNATSKSNGTAVFNYFFEDKFDTLNTSYWTHREGTSQTIVTDYYVSPPSSLRLYYGTGSPYHADVGHALTTAELPNADEKLIVEAMIRNSGTDPSTASSPDRGGIGLWNATTHSGSNLEVTVFIDVVRVHYSGTIVAQITSSNQNIWRHIKIEYTRATNTVTGYFEGIRLANTSLVYTGNLFVALNITGYSHEERFDDFRLYKVKYSPQEPSLSFQRTGSVSELIALINNATYLRINSAESDITLIPVSSILVNPIPFNAVTQISVEAPTTATLLLEQNFTLVNITLNGAEVTYTYSGTETKNGFTYRLYNFSIDNGTLSVNVTLPNSAYAVTFIADGSEAQPPFVVGERVRIISQVEANIAHGATNYLNVTDIELEAKSPLQIYINKPALFRVGMREIANFAVYANRAVTVLDKSGFALTATVSVYNLDKNKVTTLDRIEAGNNSILVYYRDIKIAEIPSFRVNHTNITDSLIVTVNATRTPADYFGKQKFFIAQKAFTSSILNDYVTKFALNFSEPSYVYYNISRNTSIPTLILSNCSLIRTEIPLYKLYCSGNATIAEGFKLNIVVKDTLNNALNFTFDVDGVRTTAGVLVDELGKTKQIAFPAEFLGFKLKTNATLSVPLFNDTNVTAIYKVPTKIETREVRIARISFPIPIPFPFATAEEKPATVRLEGAVTDYYGNPVRNKAVTIDILTNKTNRTIVIATDGSGQFKVDVDLAKDVTYTIKYSIAEDETYVGYTTTRTLSYESLPPTPTEEFVLPILPAILAVLAVVSVIGIARVLRKRAKATLLDERTFRFYRRRD
ncbi:MAG: DUF2341 domain-containing protein [Archaeoglobaceae archaeon]